jgi:hypothetical protein
MLRRRVVEFARPTTRDHHLKTAKAAIEMTGLTQRPGGKLWLIAAGIAVVVIVIVLIAAYGGGGSGGGGGGY